MFAEACGGRGRRFRAIEKPGGTPLVRNVGETERQRSMRHARAANVKPPREIVRVTDDKSIGTPQGFAHPRDLCRHTLARVANALLCDRAYRRLRTGAPDRVYRIGVERRQSPASLLARCRKSRPALGRVQARTVTQPVPPPNVSADPVFPRPP